MALYLFDITYIFYSKNKNKQNLKRAKRIWMKPWLKYRNDKSACDNIFSELPPTDKFRHYLWMNAASYYWSCINFYTLITYAFYITYTYNYEICIHYFIIYWFLKFSIVHVFPLYKQLPFYYAVTAIELWRLLLEKHFIEQNFSFWNVSWNLKKQFKWNLI